MAGVVTGRPPRRGRIYVKALPRPFFIKGVIMSNNQMFIATMVLIVVAVAIAMIIVNYFL